VTAMRFEDADFMEKQDLWLIEVPTGRMVQVLEGEGHLGCPRWSPDGSKIAFVGTDGSHGSSTTNNLWVLPVEGFLEQIDKRESFSAPTPLSMCDARNLTREMDRPVGNFVSCDMSYIGEDVPFAWIDDNSLFLLVCDKGATGLYEAVFNQDSEKYEATRLWSDPLKNALALRVGGNRTLLQIGSPSQTDNLYLLNRDEKGSSLSVLYESNLWLDEIDLGNCERFVSKGDEGWDIDGWLIYPSGYERGKRYPTVLFIHGGPHGVYGSSFMFQCQIFASLGYAVVYANPRGSQSYGQDFAYACVGDWGGSDFKDIMAAVDHVVDMGIADPNRLFVTGWSYGGFMTSWTVTQTDRFRAAIAGAIISDRYSMYGTTDIPLFMEHHCAGLPWETRDNYFERSAIAYVENVKTPIMFIHGEGDLRCPISQSEEFYLSLKRLHKTAVMVRYPGEFHGFTKPSHKFDRFERMLAWFDYYAKDK
nr:S9 family peptidase [Bacillota bacterium]